MSPDNSDPTRHSLPTRRTISRRLIRFLVRYIALPYLIICAIFGMMQRRLMYPARVITEAEVTSLLNGASNVRPLRIATKDQLRLHGLLWQVAGAEPPKNTARPVVLYFPGNGGCRFDRLDLCDEFSKLGCDVALFDYRGYGENAGKPSEPAIVADAHAIWNHLTQELNIPASQIVLYGESLGGGVATRLAADLSREKTPPGGLLVSSTFSSMTETARYHYPYLPVRWMLFDRYDSQSRISEITCPIIMVHGTADTIVPFTYGQQLFAKAAAESQSGLAKQFIEAPGAGHNDVPFEILCSALRPLIESVTLE